MEKEELEDYLVEKMCKIACKFYKEGDNIDKNEKLQCGGFKIMRAQLESGKLDNITFEKIAKNVDVEITVDQPLSDLDKYLVKNFCRIACGFYTKDEHGEGNEYLQCGGYRMIRNQIEQNLIDKETIKDLVKKIS